MVNIPVLATRLMPKWAVDYTSNANHPDEQCRYCTYYNDPYSCDKVMGHVLPGGWCKLFKEK